MQLIIIACDVHENPGPNKLLIAPANVRSLCPENRSLKIDEIESILFYQEKCDIICISESWLDSTIPDGQVAIDGFQIYRKDRFRQGNRREARGVAIYARDDIPIKRRLDLEVPEIELIILELITANKKVFI